MIPVCQSATEVPAKAPWLSTRSQIALGGCLCAGGALFLFAVNPNLHAVYPQCPLYHMTGFYCAGCGATRALYALLHGRVLEALHDNVLFVTALPVILFLAGSYVGQAWMRNAWPKVVMSEKKLLWIDLGIVAVMLGFMALRNLPGWPFEYLKPLAA